MIYISKPFIEIRGEEAFLISNIKDESRVLESQLWYSVDKQYCEFLCDDYADCFLIVLLAIAMKRHQDIVVEAPISRKLLFNIQNTIQPLWNKILPDSKIVTIKAEAKDDILYHGKGVGCGCSLGIDSMASLLKHLEPDVTPGYRVTHLTLFNSGQMGDYELEESEKNFRNKLANLHFISEELGLPVVGINSNLNEIYRYCGVTLLQSFVQRTASCAMALQKLFGRYVYASSYSIEQFEMGTFDESHMESAFVPLLSTENFELILSNPMMTRVEKTEYVSHSAIAPKYLDVCWAEQTALEIWHNTQFLEGKTKVNCGWCDKCLRTLLTLDVVLGSVRQFEKTFEISKYYERKNEYIVKVFKECEKNIFYREMVDLMLERNYPIPNEAIQINKSRIRKKKFIALQSRIVNFVTTLPKRIYNKIK